MATKLTYMRGNSGSGRGRDGAMLSALCLAVAAWTVAGSIALAADFRRSDPLIRKNVAQEAAGIFTGAFVNGVPVYRLPSIHVVAHRDAEFAGVMREIKAAAARGAEANELARPCPHIAESATSLTHVRVL